MKKVLIGHVGVDSGQLLLCDPCNIDSQWKEEEFIDIRIYEHVTTKEKLQYRVDFPHYEQEIPKYGKTMNELISTGEWKQFDVSDSAQHSFSYNSCCLATLSEKRNGQLHNEFGHEVGVAFSTACGDGAYPVYAMYSNDGILKSVTVEF
jgi:hypothetical protein